MNAAEITEFFGRGVPATLDTAMNVDVCAYLRSTQSPVALVLTTRGEARGVLSHRDIVHTSGRLGSSVMQMTAGELVRDQAPVCQASASLIEVLELLTETTHDFVLVCDGSTVRGVITLQDVAELLTQAMGSETSAAGEGEDASAAIADVPPQPELQYTAAMTGHPMTVSQPATVAAHQPAASEPPVPATFEPAVMPAAAVAPMPVEPQPCVHSPAAALPSLQCLRLQQGRWDSRWRLILK